MAVGLAQGVIFFFFLSFDILHSLAENVHVENALR